MSRALDVRVQRLEAFRISPTPLCVRFELGGDRDAAERLARSIGAVAILPSKCRTDEEWVALYAHKSA